MVRFALAAAVTALVVALAATIDHRHKREVEFAAQEAAWFCAHGKPSSCRDFDEVGYEQRWEDRELGYRITFFTLSAAAVGFFGTAAWKRRRSVRRPV